MRWTRFAGLIATLVAAAGPGRAAASGSCEALVGHRFQGFTIHSAQLVDPGALPAAPPTTAPMTPVCRVAGVATPSADSAIGFEVWIPVAGAWNHRMQVFGNGGYVGKIPFAEMGQGLAGGYAVAGGDTGHVTQTMPEDLRFAVGHPEKMKDWGYRSIHAVTLAAKAVTAALDGAPPRWSYYFGCSTGGGQGLAEVQRYPLDFDGVVAGAPGNNRTHLNAGALWGFAQNHRDAAGFIPATKFALLARATMSACDGLDGVVDGIIADPRACHFDPGALACADTDGPGCFTAAQLATLARIRGGTRDPRTGALIYPAWPVGTEAVQGLAVSGTAPVRVDFWKDWVFDDPQWDWRTFDFDKDMAFADRTVGPIVNNVDPDIARFVAHGGKLLLYHGWADPIGNAYDTIGYFEAVQAHTPGARSAVELYMMPGMGHCRGGPGPDVFDKPAVIEAWVERGLRPGAIIASHLDKGAVTMSRPICPFPSAPVYTGGDPRTAASFTCRKT